MQKPVFYQWSKSCGRIKSSLARGREAKEIKKRLDGKGTRVEKYIAEKNIQTEIWFRVWGLWGSYVFVCLSIIVWEERNFCTAAFARRRARVLEYPLISQTHTHSKQAGKRLTRSLARFETNKQQLGSTLWPGYKKTQKHLRRCRAKLLYAEGTLVECE